MAPDAALLAALAFLGALVVGLTGFGSALVTIPLATHFVPLQFALPLFALVDLATAFSVGLENQAPFDTVFDQIRAMRRATSGGAWCR